MEIFATILTGVGVFVLGQIVLKWLIEPIQNLRIEISNVLYLLANDHSIIHNANIVVKEQALATSKNLRMSGAKLIACQQLIPFYEKTSKICRLPKKDNLSNAAKKLSLMSNTMWGKESETFYLLDLYRVKICENLGVSDPVEGSMSKQELINGIEELREIKRNTK